MYFLVSSYFIGFIFCSILYEIFFVLFDLSFLTDFFSFFSWLNSFDGDFFNLMGDYGAYILFGEGDTPLSLSSMYLGFFWLDFFDS